MTALITLGSIFGYFLVAAIFARLVTPWVAAVEARRSDSTRRYAIFQPIGWIRSWTTTLALLWPITWLIFIAGSDKAIERRSPHLLEAKIAALEAELERGKIARRRSF